MLPMRNNNVLEFVHSNCNNIACDVTVEQLNNNCDHNVCHFKIVKQTVKQNSSVNYKSGRNSC